MRLSATPGQKALARDIERAGDSLIHDYSIPLVTAASRGDHQAHGVAATLEGKRRVDALRKQFDRYESTQEAVITARESAADEDAREAVVAASVGLAGSMLLIATFAGYVVRAVVWPVRKAAGVASPARRRRPRRADARSRPGRDRAARDVVQHHGPLPGGEPRAGTSRS
ncbi:hypothetical protein GCM10017687_47570 [Streptomyces echinatus]|uniref:hypothetical protein n=1 Tax=Streptomyces echinatus TaxID=67293 RepID=UPI0031EA7DF4